MAHQSRVKIGIVVNERKPSAAAFLVKLRKWLSRRSIQILDTTRHPFREVLKSSSLIICLGGDGTILYTAARMTHFSTPVLGVNLGSLGFLTEVKQNEIFGELTAFLKGNYSVEERLMLSCVARRGNKKLVLKALNDIVISREGLSRIMSIEVLVNSEKLTHFTGDGVIVATPTGSTAYSLSAGGSVVHPKLEALIITPICPHASSLRSMVVSAHEKITIRQHGREHAGSKAMLTADGQENLEIDDSYSVEITCSPTPLRMLKSSKRSYFVTLRENFKFPT